MTLERVLPDYSDPQFIHHLCRYQFAERYVRGKNVLDDGCGNGYGADYLSKTASSVTGVDISEDAIGYASNNYNRSNLIFRQMDSACLQFKDETFDTAVSFEVIEHLSPVDCESYIKEIKRVVKKGGIILISTPNHDTARIHLKSEGISICPHHINNLVAKEFKRLLKPHFNSFAIYGQRLKGSFIYSFLRTLDIFNLRLRLFSPSQREAFYVSMDMKKNNNPKTEDYVISRYMIHQCQTFVAVCNRL